MELDNHQLDEVEYFSDIAKIRYCISHLMYNHHLIDAINPTQGRLNPFHMRIDKNPKAVFAVEFYHDVIPVCIYTPYGSLEINPYDNYTDLTYNFLTQSQKDAFISDFRKMFGTTVIQDYRTDEISGSMLQPVIYGITKLPWKDEIFNECYRLVTPPAPQASQLIIEREHVRLIYHQVNQKLQNPEYPELIFSNMLPKKHKVMLKVVFPKQPKYLEDLIKKEHPEMLNSEIG